MKYKYILILNYLNTMKFSYSYNEISILFGLTFRQIEYILDELEYKNIIILDKYYKLTQKGIDILKTYKLDDVDFFETMKEEDDLFIGDKIDIDEIYVPIGFTKKLK